MRLLARYWQKLELLNKATLPLTVLTSQLQDEQLTIPKYNEFWLTAESKLSNIIITTKWQPAKLLLKLIQERRKVIEENPIIQAGIYLDPRVWRSLKEEQISMAEKAIEAIF